MHFVFLVVFGFLALLAGVVFALTVWDFLHAIVGSQ